MPRVMFTISYGIKPERRDEYLALVKELREHLLTVAKQQYSVYEAKGKKNQFTEVFITNSLEEFEALDDKQDDTTKALVSRLEEFVDEEGMKYSTLIEQL